MGSGSTVGDKTMTRTVRTGKIHMSLRKIRTVSPVKDFASTPQFDYNYKK